MEKTLQQIDDELQAQVCARVLGQEVTRRQLAVAFDRVADKANWKKPVDAVVTLTSDLELLTVREAVIFFTGSVPDILVYKLGPAGVLYRVKADGYYAAIGA